MISGGMVTIHFEYSLLLILREKRFCNFTPAISTIRIIWFLINTRCLNVYIIRRLTDIRRLTAMSTNLSNSIGIKQISVNSWEVPSQSGNGTYTIINDKGIFACTCHFYQFRGFRAGKCKHILILKYYLASVEASDGKGNEQHSDTIQCKDCNSPRVIKYGKTGKRVIKQIYQCKEEGCGRYFVPDDAFTRMRNDPKIICLAIQMHCRNVSLRGISETLQDTYQLKVSYQTILNWIEKYAKLLTEYVRTLTPDFSGQINADELYIFIKRDLHYWFNAIDPHSRYLIASVLTSKKDFEGARAVFEEAKQKIGDQKLFTVITDGLGAYKKAFKKVFYSNKYRYREHIADARINGATTNNIMERVNNTIRDREKVMRRIKSPKSPIFLMFPIYYNWLRKHQSLDLTPAQAAGMGFDLGNNKLLGLIEKAYEHNKAQKCNNIPIQNKDWSKIDSYFESTESNGHDDSSIGTSTLVEDSIQTYQEPASTSRPDDVFVDSTISESKQSKRIRKGWKNKGWL